MKLTSEDQKQVALSAVHDVVVAAMDPGLTAEERGDLLQMAVSIARYGHDIRTDEERRRTSPGSHE